LDGRGVEVEVVRITTQVSAPDLGAWVLEVLTSTLAVLGR
jgi:hypothetical protein